MTERQHEGAGSAAPDRGSASDPPLQPEPSSQPADPPTNGARDERMRQPVEAARGPVEERATAEILALERDLERERERAAKPLDEVQRRLDEITGQIEAAGKRVEGAETRLVEEQTRLKRDAEERLDAEMHRLQAESDAKIEAAFAKAEAETRARMEEETERRLAEQEKMLRAEAEERVRITTETVRAETERRLQEGIDGLRTGRRPILGRLRRSAEMRRAKREAEAPEPRRGIEPLDLNVATFEQLRELGMSVTQATRVIAYREREGGFGSPDDLARVPGISMKALNEIKARLTA